MKEERNFYPELNLERAFSTLSSSELGMDTLRGKSVYYFDSDEDITRPDKAGIVPLDFISKLDSDSIIILGKNTARQKLEGKCAMLAVMNGNVDFGINAAYRFGWITKPDGKRVRKFFHPSDNMIIPSQGHQAFRIMDAFLTAAQSLARNLPPSDNAVGHRLISRDFPGVHRRTYAKPTDTVVYH